MNTKYNWDTLRKDKSIATIFDQCRSDGRTRTIGELAKVLKQSVTQTKALVFLAMSQGLIEMVTSPKLVTSTSAVRRVAAATASHEAWMAENAAVFYQKSFMDWMLTEATAHYEQLRAGFVKRIDTAGPAEAFRWLGEDLIKAEEQHSMALRAASMYDRQISEGQTPRNAAILVCQNIVSEITDRLLEGRFANGSTCQMTNLTTLWQHVAQGKLISRMSFAGAIGRMAEMTVTV